MKVKTLACIVLLVIGLISCIDDKYDFNNIDTTMGIETELVGPLAYSKLNIVDVLNVDSLGDLEVNIKGDTMYLVKRDSQYLGNELIDQLQVLPSTTFNLNVPIGLLNLIEPTDAHIDYDLDLKFPNVNTNENERLDSILMGESDIDIRINFPVRINRGSYLEITFKEDELLLNPRLYPDNSIYIDLSNVDKEHPIVETHVDLYGAMLRLSGRNNIHINFKGYVSTTNDMNISDQFEIFLDCTHMKPHITFINIGNARDIVENVKEIEFDYAQDVYMAGMNLPFYDPSIFMTCHNNIGMPARYYIDYVEGISTETGEVVTAEFNGEPSTSIVLNTPSYDEIAGLSHRELLNYDVKKLTKYTELTLDRENGRTDKLFKIKVDKLRYKYRIRSEETDRSKVHFFFYDSDIKTKEITKLPLWFEGDAEDPEKNFRLTRQDTVALAMGSIPSLQGAEISGESKAVLKFYYKNHLPLGVDAKLKFIDKYDNEIMRSSAREFVIKSGKVDELGNVIKETEPEEMLMLVLSYKDLQRLMSEDVRVVFDYKLENEEHKNIFLNSTDWLDLKIMFHITASATLEPDLIPDSDSYPETEPEPMPDEFIGENEYE